MINMKSRSMFMTSVMLLGLLFSSLLWVKSNSVSALSSAAPDPVPASIFGVEMNQLTPAKGLDQMEAANASWTRRNGVRWSAVEPTEGVRDWSALASLESELQDASSRGIQVILIVRSTPEWARKIVGSGSTCGPIHANKLAAFGSFMNELVARYSAPPYNVKHWELWNEPDVDPSLVPANSVYGCWGDQNDAFYGGRHYAEMLKVAYPQIKAADPHAQVLLGGLLLDCDPRPGAGCEAIGHSKLPARFLEGVLLNSGGLYFDGISFHAYDFYQNQLGQYHNPGWQSAWNTTGPSTIAKAQFIQSILSQYSVSGKYLMNTETALLCTECSGDATFETSKAYYLAQSYSTAIARGLRANIWFSLLGWRNSGLLNADLSPRPAYTAFQFSRNTLQDATSIRAIVDYVGVKGYEFQQENRRIWVLWSLDGNTHSVNLPAAPVSAWDALGTPVSPDASIDVSLNPLYLEWNMLFSDVPVGYWAASWIERLYNAGVTGGCAISPTLRYCPENTVTRAQMAIFLLKGMHGSSFSPPEVGADTGFGDVPASHWAAAWIKQLAAEGITSGCGNGNYCPENSVTRAQMAVFLLKAKYSAGYAAPEVGDNTGFNDVPASHWAAAWIKQLAAEGITGGCGLGVYCPENPVTRAQMAVFLVRTFGLP